MTRIRYELCENNALQSKWFKTPTNEISVIIENNEVTIVDIIGNFPYKEQFKTLHAAKKAAKKTLVALGVPFEQEVRPRIKDHINENIKKQYESENRGDQ